MAAGEDGDERALDHDILAEDDGGGGLMGALHPLGRGFEPGDDIGVSLGYGAHWGSLGCLGAPVGSIAEL